MDRKHTHYLTVIEAYPTPDHKSTIIEAWATYPDGSLFRFRVVVEGLPDVRFGDLIGRFSKHAFSIHHHEDDPGYLAPIRGEVEKLPAL